MISLDTLISPVILFTYFSISPSTDKETKAEVDWEGHRSLQKVTKPVDGRPGTGTQAACELVRLHRPLPPQEEGTVISLGPKLVEDLDYESEHSTF